VAAGKKNAARLGAYLVFIDESGFLLSPTVLRTWAPRGQTPIHRHRTRRDKVSVISGISVSPRGRHLGLYCRLHRHNIGRAEVCEFLRHLLRHLRGHVIVLLDNSQTHKGEPLRALTRDRPRLHIEYFPPYAPTLNPDEGVWSLAKRRLANGRPRDIAELRGSVAQTLARIAKSSPRLRGCVEHSELPPFLT
jgi:transposase